MVVTLGWLGMLAIVPWFWQVSSGVAVVRLVGALNKMTCGGGALLMGVPTIPCRSQEVLKAPGRVT